MRFDSSMVREHVQIANLQTMTADLFLPNLNMQLPDYKWCCQACHLLMKITKITSVKRSQFTGVNLLLSKKTPTNFDLNSELSNCFLLNLQLVCLIKREEETSSPLKQKNSQRTPED